jgi:sec-independent protein translocase protein TatA
MGFANFGFSEILIVCLIVLLLFGAKRIPDVAASFGKGIREFKRSVHDLGGSIEQPLPPSGVRSAAPSARDAELDRDPLRLT